MGSFHAKSSWTLLSTCSKNPPLYMCAVNTVYNSVAYFKDITSKQHTDNTGTKRSFSLSMSMQDFIKIELCSVWLSNESIAVKWIWLSWKTCHHHPRPHPHPHRHHYLPPHPHRHHPGINGINSWWLDHAELNAASSASVCVTTVTTLYNKCILPPQWRRRCRRRWCHPHVSPRWPPA